MSRESDQAVAAPSPTVWHRIGWPLFLAGIPFGGWSTPGLLLLIADWVVSRRRLKVSLPPIYRYAVISLIVVFVLASAASNHPFDSFGTAFGFTLTLFFGADYCFRLARAGEAGSVLQRDLWPVPIAGTAHALLGIYQYITTNVRAAGTTINPNHLGTLMVIAGFLGGVYLLSRSDWRRWLTIPYGLVIIGGLLASGSRGSWVGAAAGLLIVAGLYFRGLFRENARRALRISGVAVLVMAASVALTLQMASPQFQTRALSIFDIESNMDRVILYRSMGRLILANPWLGVGLNNLKYEYAQYRVEPTAKAHGMAHNLVLQVLGETGILGLVATSLLLGFWLLRGFPRTGPRELWWLYGLLIALLVRDQFDGTLLNLNLAFLLNWLGGTLAGYQPGKELAQDQ